MVKEYTLLITETGSKLIITEETLNYLASNFACKNSKQTELYEQQLEANALAHGFYMSYRYCEQNSICDVTDQAWLFYSDSNNVKMYSDPKDKQLIEEAFRRGFEGGKNEFKAERNRYKKC